MNKYFDKVFGASVMALGMIITGTGMVAIILGADTLFSKPIKE